MKIKTLLFLLLSTSAFAQQFTVSSKITGVTASGLHSVPLTPEFRSHADVNLSGIRIWDSKKKEVPYLLEKVNEGISKYNFKEYTILSKSVVADTASQVVIQNTDPAKWDAITLAIANTDATKTYSISGSHDNKEWFGLVNNQMISGLYSHTDTLVYKTLPMPVNAYRYLKISFNDKKTLPLNILAAGSVNGTHTAPTLLEAANSHIKIMQLALEKKTRITISFNDPVTINRIAFAIKSPSLYKRDARLFVQRAKRRKKKTVPYMEEFYSFDISSSSKNVIDGLNLNENTVVIEIDNKDNEPLEIASVKVYQNPVKLIADLKPGEQYTVMAGNKKLNAPDYDLENFRDQISNDIPTDTLAKPVVLSAKPKGINGGKSPWIMWVCIAIGALILSYFCYSLVQDLKKKENPAP